MKDKIIKEARETVQTLEELLNSDETALDKARSAEYLLGVYDGLITALSATGEIGAYCAIEEETAETISNAVELVESTFLTIKGA